MRIEDGRDITRSQRTMVRLAAVVSLALASACGNSEAPNDMAMDLSITADVATSSTTAQATIGAGGGSVALPDGTRIDIPAGALVAATTITIMPSAATAANAIGPAYLFGPEGTQFAKPVTITLPYDPNQLTGGAIPAIATARAGSSNFSSLGGTAADATHETSSTTHFSTFVVISYVSNTDAGASLPTAIATAQVSPGAIATDGTSVYWITSQNQANGKVMKYSVSNGTTTTLAQNQNGLYSLTVDNATVYWTAVGAQKIFACAIGGCSSNPTALNAMAASVQGFLAHDSTNVYWTDGNNDAAYACAETGCTSATTLTTGNSGVQAYPIAVAGGNVFFGDKSGKIFKVLSSSSNATLPTPFYADPSTSVLINAMTVDASNIYFADSTGKIRSCPMTGCSGAGPILIAQDQVAAGPFALALAVDSTMAYWPNPSTGKVMRAPLLGGSPTTIAASQTGIQSLAIDRTNVYWTLVGTAANNFNDGSVWTVAKN